jgi:uncharacterized protein with LGFP repeats
MRNLFKLFLCMGFLILALSCSKKEDTATTPDYQTAIEAKYKALGWDKDGHSPFNGTGAVKTAGGSGYVQYYAFGSRKTAIYYYDGSAFAVDTEEMIKYDALGQDNWGKVTSDPKATKTGGCGYIDVKRKDGSEGIITCQNLVDGDVYQKYKALNRWDGPLGLPTASVLLTPANATDKGVFGSFQNGVIWYTPTVKAVALWGKVLKMYAAIDYERSWLKYPTESCDPNKADNNQNVNFERGSIKIAPTNSAGCGTYYEISGLPRLQNGTASTNPPCY